MQVLCVDGVYTRVGGKPLFRNVDAITGGEVADLIEAISQKVMRHLKKQGYLDKDGELVVNPQLDEFFNEHESLSGAAAASIAGKIAFGPHAGNYVTRIGKGFGYGEEIPLAEGKRCFTVNGFSLHANTHVNALAKNHLDKLIQYMARGALSNERLELTDDRKIKLRLKTPYSDGTTHFLFTYSEFIEKLVALTSPPRSHLVRWGGVFAPNSPYRKEISLKPQIKKGFPFESGVKKDGIKNCSWSKMLAKVFKIDVTKCESCGGERYAICSIQDRLSVQRYLKHVGIDHASPVRAPPRAFQQSELFDLPPTLEEPVIYID